MKLTALMDFYEKKYGLEEGLSRVKKQGYEAVVYTLPRHEDYMKYQWTEDEFRNYFTNIGKTIKESGLSVAFTTTGTGLYNDCVPDSYENRVDMCIKGVRASAYMGSEVFLVRPVKYFRGHEDGVELSKQLTYDALKRIYAEAERQSVRLAIVNSGSDYIYGWNVEELAELSNEFDMDIVIDPAEASHAGCKLNKLVRFLGDRVVGVFMRDTLVDLYDTAMPFMGRTDYLRMVNVLKDLPKESALVTVQNLNYMKYQDFLDSEELVKALDELYFTIGSVVSGKGSIS